MYAIEEAMKGKSTKCGDKYRGTFQLLLRAFSTCRDYSSSAQDLFKEPVQIKAGIAADFLEASASPEFEPGCLADCASDGQ